MAISAVLLLCCFTASVLGGTWRADRDEQYHLDQADLDEFSSVGRVNIVDDGENFIGSGTLVNAYTVMTVAHVVYGWDGTDEGTQLSFTLNGITYGVLDAVWHENYVNDPNGLSVTPAWDIGIFTLTSAVEDSDVTPATLHTDDVADLVGLTAHQVGYGAAGTGATGAILPAGTKRAGPNVISIIEPGGGNNSLTTNYVYRSDFDDPDDVTADNYADPVPLDREYLIAGGDSGGGDFVNISGAWYLVGANVEGTGLSQYGDNTGHVLFSSHQDWIEETRLDLNAPDFTDPTGVDPPFPWFSGTVGGLSPGWGSGLDAGGFENMDAGYLPVFSISTLTAVNIDQSSSMIRLNNITYTDNDGKTYTLNLYAQNRGDTDGDGIDDFAYAAIDFSQNFNDGDLVAGFDAGFYQFANYDVNHHELEDGSIIHVITNKDTGHTIYHVIDGNGNTQFLDLIELNQTFTYGLTDTGWAAGFLTEPDDIQQIGLRITPIPEPTTLALLGLGGLAMLRRRRR